MMFLLPAALWILCITDAGFAGFRDACGRDARIFKSEYYRRAIRRGLRYGLVVSGVAGLWVGALVVVAPSPSVRLNELIVTAGWMVPPLGVYATSVLLALGVWASAEVNVRTLASVVLLGPLTMIRPWVIAGAAALGAWKAPTVAAGLAAGGVCALQLLVGPLLGRGWHDGVRAVD